MATTSAETDGAAKRTRLIVDISPELRRRIRIAAAENDLSVKVYIERILEQIVPDQPSTHEPMHPDMPQAVEDLLQFQARVRHAHPGVEYEDSVDVLGRTRQERDAQQEHQE